MINFRNIEPDDDAPEEKKKPSKRPGSWKPPEYRDRKDDSSEWDGVFGKIISQDESDEEGGDEFLKLDPVEPGSTLDGFEQPPTAEDERALDELFAASEIDEAAGKSADETAAADDGQIDDADLDFLLEVAESSDDEPLLEDETIDNFRSAAEDERDFDDVVAGADLTGAVEDGDEYDTAASVLAGELSSDEPPTERKDLHRTLEMALGSKFGSVDEELDDDASDAEQRAADMDSTLSGFAAAPAATPSDFPSDDTAEKVDILADMFKEPPPPKPPQKVAKGKLLEELFSEKLERSTGVSVAKKNPLEGFLSEKPPQKAPRPTRERGGGGVSLTSLLSSAEDDHAATLQSGPPQEPVDPDAFSSSLAAMVSQSQSGTTQGDAKPPAEPADDASTLEVAADMAGRPVDELADETVEELENTSTIFMDLEESSELQVEKGLLVNRGGDDELAEVDLDSLFSGELQPETAADESASPVQSDEPAISSSAAEPLTPAEAPEVPQRKAVNEAIDEAVAPPSAAAREEAPALEGEELDELLPELLDEMGGDAVAEAPAALPQEESGEVVYGEMAVDPNEQTGEEEYLKDMFTPTVEIDEVAAAQAAKGDIESAVESAAEAATVSAQAAEGEDEFGDFVLDELEDVSSLLPSEDGEELEAAVAVAAEKSVAEESSIAEEGVATPTKSALDALNDMMGSMDSIPSVAEAEIEKVSLAERFGAIRKALSARWEAVVEKSRDFSQRMDETFSPLAEKIRTIPGFEKTSFTIRDWAGYLGSAMIFCLILDNILRRW